MHRSFLPFEKGPSKVCLWYDPVDSPGPDMSDGRFSSDGVSQIAKLLQTLPALEELQISDCDLKDRGAEELLEALIKLRTDHPRDTAVWCRMERNNIEKVDQLVDAFGDDVDLATSNKIMPRDTSTGKKVHLPWIHCQAKGQDMQVKGTKRVVVDKGAGKGGR